MFADVLYEVVGERVEVVDEQDVQSVESVRALPVTYGNPATHTNQYVSPRLSASKTEVKIIIVLYIAASDAVSAVMTF